MSVKASAIDCSFMAVFSKDDQARSSAMVPRKVWQRGMRSVTRRSIFFVFVATNRHLATHGWLAEP